MSSSGFENWTNAQVEEHNRKIASRSYSGPVVASDAVPKVLSNIIVAPSTDVQKLNKTERAFYNLLLVSGHQFVWTQAITLKLADDCRFTVDFVVLTSEGKLVAYETKGFFRDDAKVKIKIAARMFPIFKFIVVTKSKQGWKYSEVKP